MKKNILILSLILSTQMFATEDLLDVGPDDLVVVKDEVVEEELNNTLSMNIITIDKVKVNDKNYINEQCQNECKAEGKEFDKYQIVKEGDDGYDPEMPTVECYCK